MRKRIQWSAAVMIAASILLLQACGKPDSGTDHKHTSGAHHKGGMTQGSVGTTRIVKHDGLQFAFDLQDKQKHLEMMKMMKAKMKHRPDSAQFVALTVIDLKTKKLVGDAKVSFTITGPDGKPVTRAGELMAGQGMAHYVAGFAKGAPGKYSVAMSTAIAGKKHAHEVEFDLK